MKQLHSVILNTMNRAIFLYVVCLTMAFCFGFNETHESNLLEYLIPENYSRYESPAIFSSSNQLIDSAQVICDVQPKIVNRISMANMEFTADLKIRIYWLDYRLKPPGTDIVARSSVTIPRNLFVKLWNPSIFLNCKGSEAVLIPNDSEEVELSTKTPFSSASKEVVALSISYRKEFTFRCALNFVAYPFDIQRCDITIKIIHNKENDVKLNMSEVTDAWKRINVPPGFRLIHYTLIDCGDKRKKGHYRKEHRYLFFLQRIFAQQIMLIYIPSILIVILSWISFWLDVKNAAPRIALGLTTLLTLSTQFNSAQKDLPAVAEIKAIDIWMFVCMFMVFASLIEYALVVSCDSKHPIPTVVPRRSIPFPNEFKRKRKTATAWVESQRHTWCSKHGCCIVPATRIDAIACFVFPVVFFLFNFGYWSYYLVDVENRFLDANVTSVCL